MFENVMLLGPAASEGVKNADVLYDFVIFEMLAPSGFVRPVAFRIRLAGLVEIDEDRFADPFNDFHLEVHEAHAFGRL